MVHLKGLGPLKIFEFLDLLSTGLLLSLVSPYRQTGYSHFFYFGYGNLTLGSISDAFLLSKGDAQRRAKVLCEGKYCLGFLSIVRPTDLFPLNSIIRT